jgi:hypothetical protein
LQTVRKRLEKHQTKEDQRRNLGEEEEVTQEGLKEEEEEGYLSISTFLPFLCVLD